MRTFGKAKYPGKGDRAEAQCGKHSFDFRTKFDIEKYSFVPVFGVLVLECVCVSVVCRCKLHSVKHVHCPHGRTIYIVVFMANVTL